MTELLVRCGRNWLGVAGWVWVGQWVMCGQGKESVCYLLWKGEGACS